MAIVRILRDIFRRLLGQAKGSLQADSDPARAPARVPHSLGVRSAAALTRIGDWDFEYRLSSDPRPIVVMFFKTGERGQGAPREALKRMAFSHPEARFFEIDLLENPSLIERFSLARRRFAARWPVTLVFVDGVERARCFGSRPVGAVARILGLRPHLENDAQVE